MSIEGECLDTAIRYGRRRDQEVEKLIAERLEDGRQLDVARKALEPRRPGPDDPGQTCGEKTMQEAPMGPMVRPADERHEDLEQEARMPRRRYPSG